VVAAVVIGLVAAVVFGGSPLVFVLVVCAAPWVIRLARR
jgi:hypothetical protein